jgi:hypothetical protein
MRWPALIRVYVDHPRKTGPRRRQTEGPALDQLTHIGLDVHKDTIAVAGEQLAHRQAVSAMDSTNGETSG